MIPVYSNGHNYIKGRKKPNSSKTAFPPPKKKNTGKNPTTFAQAKMKLFANAPKRKIRFF